MNTEEQREKVVRGLECCIITASFCRDDCPYIGKGDENDYCDEKLFKDALALLKAQEPRVMTLEEVVNGTGAPAWFEGRSARAYTGWVLIYDVQEGMGITGTRVGVTKPGHITIWPAVELYGTKWRCWTDRPTKEQREAVKWH